MADIMKFIVFSCNVCDVQSPRLFTWCAGIAVQFTGYTSIVVHNPALTRVV
jgi:hypothetical protein